MRLRLLVVGGLFLAACSGLVRDGANASHSPDEPDDTPGHHEDAGTSDTGTNDAGVEDAGTGDAGMGSPDVEPALSERLFDESTTALLNPERGFNTYIELLGTTGFSSVRSSGFTLVITPVRLDAFRTSPIDAATLNTLEARLGEVRDAGLKVILRFQYNDGPEAGQTTGQDATRAQVLAHLAQLEPILERNADVIAVMQAGFIGAWGEWHSSSNGLDNAADRQAILEGILNALPASRMVQVRTPHFVDEIFPGGALTSAQSFNGSNVARTGHHNDCFLASEDDFGTYQAPIDSWKSYVAAGTRFTPMGGETCAVNAPRSTCTTAMAELERLQFRYLNILYHPDVLASWTSGGCMEEIRQRLGYRFVLESVRHSASVRPGGVLRLQWKLRNEGYGALFNARPLNVVLEKDDTRLSAPLTSIDVRRWEPGTHALDVQLRLPATMASGSWKLSLHLPDEAAALSTRPEYAIQFANVGTWDAARGLNVVVPELVIHPEADGQADPNATTFVQLP